MQTAETAGSVPATSKTGDGERSAARALRRRLIFVLVPLLILLVLWIWLFFQQGAFAHGPNGKTFSGDLAMFVGASRLLAAGHNPYDPGLLFVREKSWLATQGVHMIAKRGVVRVGNPPLFLWALGPLDGLPYVPTAWAAFAVAEGVLLAGLLMTLHALGWTARLVPAVCFLLMPQALLAGYNENVVPLVFLGIALALLACRRHPYLCGAALALCWLKPPVGLPMAMLIMLFAGVDLRRVLTGFAGTSMALLGATLTATGGHVLVEWVRGLGGYSADIGQSPSIASLSGLYVRWAPPPVRDGLEGAALLAALALTVYTWRRRDRFESPIGPPWLWMVWMLAVPYAHVYDEIVLTAPLAVLFGINGAGLVHRGPVFVLYLVFFSLMVVSAAPGGIALLCVPLIAMTVIAWREEQRRAAVSLAA